ncbi:MAG: M20 family metallo-hydrolase [Candidatus Saccharicenans sp.]|nr:M20 family metallo-hydrolase [Candidatus Saccharicenans sp.]
MPDRRVFHRLARRLESFRDQMVELQVKLCALPAIAPASGGEGEARKAEFLESYLRQSGITDLMVIKAPDVEAPAGFRPNILAFYRGRNSSRTIWVMSHLDVVPPGELSQWRGDPFKAWVEKGRIYGRGVEDNQQDMVASIFAVKAMIAENLKPSYNVGLALVADEETGSKKGIEYVLNNTEVFRDDDLIIVPDAGNSHGTMIEVAEKSILWLKVRTLGKQVHGSTPEKGINSFKAASFLITELQKLYRIYDGKERLFSPPISTFEPTKKEANVPNINTIPGEDVFYMDCRILPRYRVDDVLKTAGKIAAGIEKKFKVKIEIDIVQKAPAAPPTSPRAPVVQALKKAVREVYHKEARAMGIGGGTVAALFRRAGFPAACWSRLDETAHLPNEYCIIDNMIGDAKVFAHIFVQE